MYHVDDFVFVNLKNMNIIERQLQVCLHGIQTWSDENGFRFSKPKLHAYFFVQNEIFMKIRVCT